MLLYSVGIPIHEIYYMQMPSSSENIWRRDYSLTIFIHLMHIQARTQKFFKGGGWGWGGKFWKKNVSMRVHIKTRQTCNSFSLLPFQEDCLLFFALFHSSLLFSFWNLKGGGGGCNPRNHPSRSANDISFSIGLAFSVSLGRLAARPSPNKTKA